MPDTPRVSAAVLIIGNEILSGRTQDTNLAHLAKTLNGYGIQVREARVPRVDTKGIVGGVKGGSDFGLFGSLFGGRSENHGQNGGASHDGRGSRGEGTGNAGQGQGKSGGKNEGQSGAPEGRGDKGISAALGLVGSWPHHHAG